MGQVLVDRVKRCENVQTARQKLVRALWTILNLWRIEFRCDDWPRLDVNTSEQEPVSRRRGARDVGKKVKTTDQSQH